MADVTNTPDTIRSWIPLQQFRFWCQKVLPLVFDDSISYYEVLCKLAKALNDMANNIEYLKQQMGTSGLDQLIEDMKKLEEELEKVKNGDYVDLYLDAFKVWIDQNLQQIVGRTMKFVNFGLSSDGYFVAYIPETWDFISFDTVINPADPAYGHLILRW